MATEPASMSPERGTAKKRLKTTVDEARINIFAVLALASSKNSRTIVVGRFFTANLNLLLLFFRKQVPLAMAQTSCNQ